MLQARNSAVVAANTTKEVVKRFVNAGWDVNPTLTIQSVKLTYASGSQNNVVLCQCECTDENNNVYDLAYKLSDFVAILIANGQQLYAQSLLRELHIDALGRKERFNSIREIEDYLRYQDAKAGKPLVADYTKAAIEYAHNIDERRYLAYLEPDIAAVLNGAQIIVVDHEYAPSELILDQWGNPLADMRTATKNWHRDFLVGVEIADETANVSEVDSLDGIDLPLEVEPTLAATRKA